MARPFAGVTLRFSRWRKCMELIFLIVLLPCNYYLQCQCYQQGQNLEVASLPNVLPYSAVPLSSITGENESYILAPGNTIVPKNTYSSETSEPENIQRSQSSGSAWPIPFGGYRNRWRHRRPDPLLLYSHPYRRPRRLRRLLAPSMIQKWQMQLRNRFNNRIKHAEMRREMERKSALEGEGRGYTDTFMSAAMMPLSFFAFSMIFMDVVGRLFPWTAIGKTATTTPPPRITRVEYNPPQLPKLPSFGDVLGGVKEHLGGLTDFKGFKKRKKYNKYYGWSSEEQWDDRRPQKKSKNRKKNEAKSKARRAKKKPKKKKKYNSNPLTLERLHELFVKNRPSFV